MRVTRLICMSLMALIVLWSVSYADIPHMFNYQGRLMDDAGDPLDDTVSLQFGIYADTGAATQLWIETHSSVPVSDGLFKVLLGSVTPVPNSVFDGSVRYLGIRVNSGTVMRPLTPVVGTPYSFRALYSDTAAYALNAPSGTNGWTQTGNYIYPVDVNDSVGIGTNSPDAPLEVNGPMHAIIGESSGSGTAAGVLGLNSSDGFGVMGATNNGRGVFGVSTSGYGGYFYGPKNCFFGNLGIGTDTPEELLHIYTDNSGATSFLKIQSAHASNWGEAGLRIETPQNLWHLRMDDDENGQVPDGGLSLRSQNANSEIMTWTEDGNIGIGTSNPNYPLEVVASGTALRARCTGSGIGVYGSSSTGYGAYFDGPEHFFSGQTGFGTTDPSHRITVNGSIAIQQSGTTKYHLNYYNNGFNISETSVADYRIYVKEGGNVGIGTSNPTQKLYVNGNTHVAGTFHADAFETDAIGRDNIIDEVGIAYASTLSDYVNMSSSWSSYLTKEITVPTSGYVLAIADASFFLAHDISGGSGARMAVSDMPTSLNGSSYQEFFLGDNVSAGNYYSTMACQRLFSVSAGVHTFYLIGLRITDNTTSIARQQMSLIFIPTSYGSKNGIVTANMDDNILEAENPSEPEMETAGTPSTNNSYTASINDDDNESMAKQIELLTAEIADLKRRMEVYEGQ